MQAGELELFGAGKRRGYGAQTPTVASSCFSDLAWLAWGVPQAWNWAAVPVTLMP